jgi:DNA helicase II / ATP-dependent DNA helicase PcrA
VSTTSTDLLAGLNDAQRRAAETVRGPVCLLAGAGSGKTRTITHRIANQVVSGVARPEEILAVTFTDRAARELRGRLRNLGLDRPVRAATFHAAAWAQLRYFWSALRPGEPLPEVVDSKIRLVLPAAKRLKVEARDLASEIEWAKARRIAPERYAAELGDREPPVPAGRMAEVYAAYERHKREQGLIDYDDMIGLTTDMLSADETVAATVRSRYRYFTVDEFQDVNPAQWALLCAWLGDRDELCVVGDDDQAIYSFTGATASYLTGFATRFPGAVTVALTENYRSTAEILDCANRLLRARGGAVKELTAQTSGGPEPTIVATEDDDEERDLVIRRIRELTGEGVPPSEIAICYRINSQSEPLEVALRDAGIPYVVRGDVGFFQRPEIQQAIGALAVTVQHPPTADVPPPADAGPPRPPPVDRAVERVLVERLSWNPRREPTGRAARDRWQNLAVLVEMAERVAADTPDRTLADFVAELQERAHDNDPGDPRAVNLLTLHKSKGLEFDAVFLVGVEEGSLPFVYATSDEEVEEERRLLYVGVTRARRHLQISWACSRLGRGGRTSRRRPSRFLDALQATPRHGPDAMVTERLRTWRRERAKRDGVPAYVIFPDATLDELAARRPTDPSGLRSVPGLGPTRVARYGEEILAVLSAS